MENREGKAMIATALIAVTIPVALGGLVGRTLARQPANSSDQIESFRELLSGVDRTIREIERNLSAQSEPVDWSTLVPARPTPPTVPDPSPEVPIEPPPPPPAPLFNLDLGGIVWKKGQPHAYVNGRVVTEGEMIEGFRVATIEPNQVTFEGPDGQISTCDIDVQLQNEYPGYFVP